jgi:exonuclease VII large subunit
MNLLKICSKCKIEKPFENFSKDKNRLDGYQRFCKTCVKEYYETNKNKLSIQKQVYREVNKDKILAQKKQHYEKNKDKLLIQMQNYRDENKDYFTDYFKDYREVNKDKILIRNKKYRQNNHEKIIATVSKRRSAKLNATPCWLTKQDFAEIEELYLCARMFRLYTGEEYHVDHIIPLQGKTVCGLHVPWNLQVIPAKENLSKSNKI